MASYRETLRLASLGLNRSQIADSLGISRTTVIHTLQRAAAQGLDWQSAEALSDRELTAKLFPNGSSTMNYHQPDYEHVHREMAKAGVTQELLWMEYCDGCRDTGKIPYQLTQFKKLYRDYITTTKATMHISRKPGEIMEVDRAGQTAHIVSTDTGELLDAYVFVSALPYSGYAYAEAFRDMKEPSWLAAHVNAYNYFGGVARILVPDNLKTGVTKHTGHELILNRAYHELAEHYGTAIIPTRVRTPKDKATVEGAVGNISSYILAAIRNRQFFSLQELNEVIRERLHAFNHKPFQKKDGSRATWLYSRAFAFSTIPRCCIVVSMPCVAESMLALSLVSIAEERESLPPLPRNTYEPSEWRTATVAFNYHIGVDEMYYSVPHEYIKCRVDVRLTRNAVEIFLDGTRVCSHIRLYGRRGQYSTDETHMPPNHRQYVQWNGDRFRKWAEKIGRNTVVVVESILSGHKVEQQGYRACMALLKLSDTYTPERLESACERALGYTSRPSFKSVQTILKSGHDRLDKETVTSGTPSAFGFTRGADYYKGGMK